MVASRQGLGGRRRWARPFAFAALIASLPSVVMARPSAGAPASRGAQLSVLRMPVAQVVPHIERLTRAQISVRGRARVELVNVRLTGSAPAMLETVAVATAGQWWRIGKRYVLSYENQSTTAVLAVRDAARFKGMLAQLGFLDAPLDVQTGPGIVQLSGPAGLVNEASAVARALPASAPQQGADQPRADGVAVWKGGEASVVYPR